MPSEFARYRYRIQDMPSSKPGERYIDGLKRDYYKKTSRDARFVWRKESASELGSCLVVVAGSNLSGKTTLAKEVSDAINTPILDIDANWRREWGTVENRGKMSVDVYQSNHVRALGFLKEDKPALLVATYSWQGYHTALKEFTREQRCPLRVFLLSTPEEEEHKRRLEVRKNDPNNISDILEWSQVSKGRDTYHGIEDDPNYPNLKVIKLDSSKRPEENLKIVISSLADLSK